MSLDTGIGVSKGVKIMHIKKWLNDNHWVSNHFIAKSLAKHLFLGGFRISKYNKKVREDK